MDAQVQVYKKCNEGCNAEDSHILNNIETGIIYNI